jgi:hypothetical protein
MKALGQRVPQSDNQAIDSDGDDKENGQQVMHWNGGENPGYQLLLSNSNITDNSTS